MSLDRTPDYGHAPTYRPDDFKELQPPKIPYPRRNYQPAGPSVSLASPKPTKRNAAKKNDGLWLTAEDAKKARRSASAHRRRKTA